MIGLLFWLCAGGIAYTYAGYPVLLALLARLRPEIGPYPSATPSVTLLIAAYNEERAIEEKLENSLALDYPQDRLQILVAADGSDDHTADIVRGYADRGVELSFIPTRHGKTAAIDRAMARVRGDILVFSDANNAYGPESLRELVRPFADPRVGATTGAKVIVEGGGALGDSEGLYWKYESFIKEQEARLGCCTGVSGEVFAVRRELFEPVPHGFIAADDFYLAMRLIRRGYRIAYAPRARSTERVSASPADERERRARIVAQRWAVISHAHRFLPFNRPVVAWQVLSHKFLRPLVPLAMIGALACNLLAVLGWGAGQTPLGLAAPWGSIMLAAQAAFYGLALAGARAARARGLARWLYVPAFLVSSNWAALAGLIRHLAGRQGVAWQRVPRPDPLTSEGTRP